MISNFLFRYGALIIALLIIALFAYSMCSISSMCEREEEEFQRQRQMELNKKKD